MNPIKLKLVYILMVICILGKFQIFGQFAPGFQENNVSNWNAPIDVEFDHNGRMFVAERAGKIYIFQNNIKYLILDITEEVANYGDFGLLSFTLDPEFLTNGRIYLFYTVDRHYLINYGSPSYSPTTNEQGATIARLTRYQANPADDYSSILQNSRLILIGENINSGIPQTGIYHAGGDLKFGTDGSLLISTGDGAYGADYQSQALNDGIILQEEYNAQGNWRSQLQNSMNGKILRIDPQNGNGLASNPYFNINQPKSAASRLWASGLRNPFRMALKPNTGSTDMSVGSPGTIFIGDVGQDTKEEVNVVTVSAQNFGWPRMEGFDNVYSNNPSLNPINPISPTIEWGRLGSNARVKINGNTLNVGSTGFSFSNFTGGCVILGPFYEGHKYPSNYQNNLFFSDFNSNWIKSFDFDINNNPISKLNFNESQDYYVNFTYNTDTESIFAVSINGKISEIQYTGNQNPVSIFTSSKAFGNSPLVINLDASDSFDPEKGILTYQWNFGDGNMGIGKTVSHQYVNSTAARYAISLTVTDNQGLKNTSSKLISINNTPPQIISTSVDQFPNFDPIAINNLNFNAVVIDNEQSSVSLVYKWEVFLYHNEHRHLEYTSNTTSGNYTLATVPCDNNLYFYKIELTVTDSYGLNTIFEKNIFPNCNSTDLIPPSIPTLKVENISANGFEIKWVNIDDNLAVKSIETYINGELVRFSVFGTTQYAYNSVLPIANKNYDIQVITRDFAGNFSKSSILHLHTGIENCKFTPSIYLSDLTPITATNGYGPFEIDQTNGGINANDGTPITMGGQVYQKGLGTQAHSELTYLVPPNITNFRTIIGLDDFIIDPNCGQIYFYVFKDNQLAYESPFLNIYSSPIELNVDVKNTQELKLVVENANGVYCFNWGDWGDAKFTTECQNIDNIAPSAPSNFAISNINQNNLNINWAACFDIDPIITYSIFIDNTLIGNTNNHDFVLTIENNGLHEITIQAKDSQGNESISAINNLYKCPNGSFYFNSQIPTVAHDDQLFNNPNGQLVTINILNNDFQECGNLLIDSAQLITTLNAENIEFNQNGGVIGFTIPQEGQWSLAGGIVSFMPANEFVVNPCKIKYNVKNDLNNLSNQAEITIKYKCTGVNQTISSGDWGNPLIWSCGTTPTPLNEVIINQSHEIMVTNISPTIKSLEILGILNCQNNSNIIILNH